jgi:Protein of unknown function (DUF3421)
MFLKICVFVTAYAPEWKTYQNQNEVTTYGLSCGSPGVFVGGGGSSGPATLDKGKCVSSFMGLSFNLYNCEYLVDQPGNYEWIPSEKGATEQGAVLYGGLPVGRALISNGQYRVGKISKATKNLLYSYDILELSAKTYDALVFKPYRK